MSSCSLSIAHKALTSFDPERHYEVLHPPHSQFRLVKDVRLIGEAEDVSIMQHAAASLKPGALVAIMKPPKTRLLVESEKLGHPIQEGRHMLDYQVNAIWEFLGLSMAEQKPITQHAHETGGMS